MADAAGAARATGALEAVIVGLGTAAQTHLTVLAATPGVAVVAGVDRAPGHTLTFRGAALPVYGSLSEAAERHPRASLVIVTTTTPTHAAVCEEAVEAFPAARVLLEKPAADKREEAERILTTLASHTAITVALHMAFSPEVLWAERLVRARGNAWLGPPTAIRAIFSDPYASDPAQVARRLGTSWVDSGINALSVMARFCRPAKLTSLRALGPASWSAFEGRLACRAGGADFEGLVVTNWRVTDPGRTTRIRFASGAELVMDHHAVAGYLLGPSGGIDETFGSDGRTPRRQLHYENLYRSYLADPPEHEPLLSLETSRHLHDVLLGTEARGVSNEAAESAADSAAGSAVESNEAVR